MIRRLHHTGFVVRDRARAVAFYRDVVGLKLISEYERIGQVAFYRDVVGLKLISEYERIGPLHPPTQASTR